MQTSTGERKADFTHNMSLTDMNDKIELFPWQQKSRNMSKTSTN